MCCHPSAALAACSFSLDPVTANPVSVVVGSTVAISIPINYNGCKDTPLVLTDNNPAGVAYSSCAAGGDWSCAGVFTASGVTSSSFTPGNNGPRSGTLNLTYTATSAGTRTIILTGNISAASQSVSFAVTSPVSQPTVATNPAGGLTTTGATLNGTVTSNGATTTVSFAYGTSIAYGNTVTANPSPLSGSASGTAVSHTLAGLECATTYHYRAQGVNAAGTTNGSDATFTTQPCLPSGPDHYELSLPASSVACLPITVTVTACANGSSPCTHPYTAAAGRTATLAASAGTLGATSLSFNASGVATTTLSHASAANGLSVVVNLSGESLTATNGRKCCQGGSCSNANSCSTTFSTAGFVIAGASGGAAATVPTQTAGTSSGNFVLRAVRTSTTTQACEAALSGVNSVNWAYTCNNPTTCSAGNRLVLTGNSATTIAANPNTGVTSTTAVPMTFDANGNAPFSFIYSDVGRITLHASKIAGAPLLTALSGSSNGFVVKPAGFVLSNVKCSSYSASGCAIAALASPGNNPAAASSSGTAFIPAGKPFSATVTAVDSSGSAVPNFGKETSPEGVTLAPTLVAPAGGTAGSLSNAGSFGSFSGGAATGTSFAYSEVGIITLTPSLSSGNYLGSGGAVNGTASGNVGRFYPDHFTTLVTPGCAASFTYSGQPFAATLSAHNAAGAVVGNYGGTTFAKAVTLSDGAALGTGSFTAGSSVAAAAFTSGVAAAAPAYTFTSKLTAPGELALRATDTDGASSAGHAEGNTLLRSGRLRVANGFGRENAALQLAVQAEYWTGAFWLLNGSDSCTTVPAAAVALGHYRNHLGTSTAAWSTSASAVSIAAGSGLLTLSAPAPTATGSVALALNLGSTTADQSCTSGLPASTGAALPWLRALNGACAASHDRDPAARASFGIYSPETRKTVHAREIF